MNAQLVAKRGRPPIDPALRRQPFPIRLSPGELARIQARAQGSTGAFIRRAALGESEALSLLGDMVDAMGDYRAELGHPAPGHSERRARELLAALTKAREV